jgi:hypothetical protein
LRKLLVIRFIFPVISKDCISDPPGWKKPVGLGKLKFVGEDTNEGEVIEIIVLKKGEIVERGSHAELIQKKGVYSRLQDLQSFDDS